MFFPQITRIWQLEVGKEYRNLRLSAQSAGNNLKSEI